MTLKGHARSSAMPPFIGLSVRDRRAGFTYFHTKSLK